MNTEILNTVRKVTEAIIAVEEATLKPGLSKEKIDDLDNTAISLRALRDQLILADLQQFVDALNESTHSLQVLVNDIQKSAEKLSQVSRTVKKAADAVSTLIVILGKANTAGILS